MRVSSNTYLVWVTLVLPATVVMIASGCSRTKHRLQADRDAHDVIAERNVDPRWCADDYGIEVDPRSRYFDPYNPDCPPMPPDDPTSHRYMHCVDGKKGWKHWHDNGVRTELENPEWREALAEYVEIGEDDSVKLDVDSALELAYVHSPSHQIQLETLYLSALDVVEERFRLDTQFFGGYDARYAHNGSLIPPGLNYDSTLTRFVVTPAIEGVENNRVTVGRPFAGDPALQARRRFATAGELLVGFANSFVFEFTGTDATLGASLANFSLVQPLLRGAGRDIALEQLTLTERVLLANLRAYSQYRQGFYTQAAIGELGVTGPRRNGAGTNVAVFSGQGGVGGYIGLLQQLQEIRNNEDSLSLQLRTLARLEAFLAAGAIDLVQVDQFRQSIERERSTLLLNQNSLEFTLDRYKTTTLGLPPDLPIDLDDSMIRQFQLVTREATVVQDTIAELRDRVGELPDDADVETIRQVLADIIEVVEPVRLQLDNVRPDLARMEELAPARERTMVDEEREAFQSDREQLHLQLVELGRQLEESRAEVEVLHDGLTEETKKYTTRKIVVRLGKLYRLAQDSILIQARARLEAVTVETIDLRPADAFEIALANRLDFMNARAALTDSWRMIQFNADALQSVLNVTASGDLRTARNNPVSFRAPTGTLRLGLEFDAPFTRLVERNDYRQSLINYQQNRRSFIQSTDSLHLGLRELLRQMEQLRMNLEIQRRAVTIAIRQVDMTRARLDAPVAPPQPGSRPAQFGPTAATNLLSAQNALRDTQNRFMSVWLNYYAARMRLARELGIMRLDHEGTWIDEPLPGSSRNEWVGGDSMVLGESPLPPALPNEYLELVDYMEPLPNGSSSAGGRNGVVRLPRVDQVSVVPSPYQSTLPPPAVSDATFESPVRNPVYHSRLEPASVRDVRSRPQGR